MKRIYRGRFAPSPTGPLHFGSLVAAVGSYLDAKANGGVWLVRMDDLDQSRTVPGAADLILRSLENLGMAWDETVVYQSTRSAAYESALKVLKKRKLIYPCACSRREIADSAVGGIDGPIYTGTCRKGLLAGRAARAERIMTDNNRIELKDAIQGKIAHSLERQVGDFVVKRADGYFAYQLAAVVDDADQGITDIVRGADLLDSTTRQIYLQQLLGYSTPRYAHLPVAVNVSVRNFTDPAFVDRVLAALARHRVDPGLLQLELTEELTGNLSKQLRTGQIQLAVLFDDGRILAVIATADVPSLRWVSEILAVYEDAG